MVIAGSSMVAVSIPMFFTSVLAVVIGQDLSLGLLGVGLLTSAFLAGMSVAAGFLGGLADRLGVAWSLRLALLTTTASTFSIALAARDLATICAALFFAGCAGALAQAATNRLLVGRIRPERLGLALAAKLSAPPVTSVVAGLGMPLLAAAAGWRWAHVTAGAFSLMATSVVRGRLDRGRGPDRPARRRERPSALPGVRATVMLITTGYGLAWTASSMVIAFYVQASVLAGNSLQASGATFAAAGIVSIIVRLLAGDLCDRTAVPPLSLCSALLVAGALGLLAIASGLPLAMEIGVFAALCGTWGYQGVLHLALMRMFPTSPGGITGAIGVGGLGGVLGPLFFAAVASSVGFSYAWLAGGLAAAAAAVSLTAAGRRER